MWLQLCHTGSDAQCHTMLMISHLNKPKQKLLCVQTKKPSKITSIPKIKCQSGYTASCVNIILCMSEAKLTASGCYFNVFTVWTHQHLSSLSNCCSNWDQVINIWLKVIDYDIIFCNGICFQKAASIGRLILYNVNWKSPALSSRQFIPWDKHHTRVSSNSNILRCYSRAY